MLVSSNHPPFQMALAAPPRRHVSPVDGSSANEIIVTGGHVGTHLDAVNIGQKVAHPHI